MVHNIAPGPATTPRKIFANASFTHPSTLVVLHPRKSEEPEPTEERRRVAHHGVPFQKVCKRLCTGDIMRGDAQAGEPRESEERGEGEGGGREGVVEEHPVGDC
jgi:hypothetical protein